MRSLALLLCASAVHALPSEPEQSSQSPHHANHIFNAIHSSMRQFGSSLNHNGMSLFLAHVPKDTEFYHGTDSASRVNDIEWLAFEPEHALQFARTSRRGPPGGPRRGTNVDSQARKDEHALNLLASQKPLLSTAYPDEEDEHGYLHTYRTKHALRLLYIDGQSAAKSDKGTLDVQDLVLLHRSPPSRLDTLEGEQDGMDDRSSAEGCDGTPHGPMNEAERAIGLCRLAQSEWHGKVDGFLRMEGGFEVILCDFARHLKLVQIVQAQDDSGPGHFRDDGEAISQLKAIAARYDGIGGGRVTLNYDNFVSLFSFPDALFFDDEGRPRILNKTAVVEPVRRAVMAMVVSKDASARKSEKDWQSIVDMVVSRYADRIAYLASGSMKDVESFQAEVGRALRPFVDYANRNKDHEIARCTNQFLPTSNAGDKETLAAKAVFNVSSILCRTLSAAWEVDTLAHGLSMIRNLQSWLAWTEWKKCRGCGVHEVCFVPIWPMGSEQYFEHPECLSDVSRTHGGYWGGFGHLSRRSNGDDGQ